MAGVTIAGNRLQNNGPWPTIDVKVNGNVVGKISVALFEEKEFKNGADPNSPWYSGVYIALLYQSLSKEYKDFEWIQTIETNDTPEGIESPYHDPYTSNEESDNYPFYRGTSKVDRALNSYPGMDSRFVDQPGRQANPKIIKTWHAQVSLMAKNKVGKYIALITLCYGFSVEVNSNGSITTGLQEPIPTESSEFQKKYIEKAGKIKKK